MNDIVLKFREKIKNNEFVYGIFTKSQDPMFVEIQGISEYDFVILDSEHGPYSVSQQQNNIRAALLRGLLPIVRVSELSENMIGKALDIGALGVQVPQIENAKQAKKAVKYARFYPYGERGVCRFVSAADYSAKDRNEYFKSSKYLLVILQLEGVQAISNLDEILEVEGIDIIFIGPYDLSQSLGVPGDIKNPKVLNAMINIVEKAKEKNIVVGTFTDDYEMVTKWKNMGVQYISYSTDSGMFYDYSRDVYNALRMCGEKEKKSLVLDSTLSNGGQVIDWKYSDKDIKFILDKLENSKIEFIEMGILNDTINPEGTKFNNILEVNKILNNRNPEKYFVKIEYGEYQIESIKPYNGCGIKKIRICFYKNDLLKLLGDVNILIAKGYQVILEAKSIFDYSDNEYEYFIKVCNDIKPYAVFISDDFGMMSREKILYYYKMIERLLNSNIYIGFHLHNNKQLAMANAILLLENSQRNIIIDSSIYGMGSGAGLLNTELLIEYLNDNYNDEYEIIPILEIMDSVVNNVYIKKSWGYSLPNYLSANYNANPDYAKYLVEKNNLTLKEMNNIFSMIDENKKIYFDRKYIEALYEETLNNPVDNTDFYEVKKLFYHRNIVVIAPGKSSERNKKIASKIKQDGGLIISINFMYDEELVDYIFVGNIRRMSELNKKYYYKVIATSNIPVSNVYARIKYSLLLNSQEYVKDNSGLMLLKLLSLCECSGINVIGMDGYSYNSEENYYLNELELASSMEQVDNMNLGMQIMKKKFKEMGINFIK